LSLLRLGRIDEALAVERSALARVLGRNPRLCGLCHNYLAKILLAKGDLDGAAREAAEATETLAAESVPASLSHALGTRALVDLARGDAASALDHAREGQRLLDEQGTINEGEGVVRLAWVLALRAAGQEAEARTALARAANRLFARAAAITDPELARSFLERVPENAQTLDLARTLLGG
jgi:hypothetical protein